MLQIISSCTSAIITCIFFMLIIQNILLYKDKVIKIQTLLFMTLFVIIIFYTHTIQYNVLNTLISYLLMLVIYKLIFNLSISKSILVISLTMIIYFFSDAIFCSILLQFMPVETLRGNEIIMILSNLGVGILALKFSDISLIKNSLRRFIEKLDNSQIYDRIVFVILIICVWIILLANFTPTINFRKEFFINITIMAILGILLMVYVYEKIKSKELNDKNEGLLEYIENFEEMIEKIQLTTHEYKNQLATLRFMASETKNRKAQEYIDNMIGDLTGIETKCAEELKNIPKGAIKGLLYYKIIIADKNNIKIVENISKPVHNYIKEIPESHIKSLCYILGIYMDNAIEASIESKDKKISIEFYVADNILNIIISNTYKKTEDIKKIGQKGFTTKGKGHGNGLRFVSKIVKQKPMISTLTTSDEKYFTQKIIYSKEKDS